MCLGSRNQVLTTKGELYLTGYSAHLVEHVFQPSFPSTHPTSNTSGSYVIKVMLVTPSGDRVLFE